jgi:hypothetical protein
MKYFFLALGFFFMISCHEDANQNQSTTKPTVDNKQDAKNALQANLPPPTDISQFNWIYSAFALAAADGNDSAFNVFINPKYGLWVIHSNGALPQFTHISKVAEYKNIKGKGLIPIVFWDIKRAPKEETLPVVDCSKQGFYSKQGCYSQEQNTFLEEKMWLNAGLNADQDKEVAQLATTITRTVLDTFTFKYYFSLIDGSWYLTFIDIRKPCEA